MNLSKTLLSALFALPLLAVAAAPVTVDFKLSEPFSASTMALPGQAGKPMVVLTGGKAMSIGGQLILANGRITIGADSMEGTVADSSATARPTGVLDLSQPYTVTVKVREVKSTKAGKDHFYIYVNNSTSKQGESPLGKQSLLVKVPVGELKVGDNVFAGQLGDATSFLQLRTESGAQVNIESVTVSAQ